ncbi:hypothetical protein ACFQE1_04985 [Halobium palmae]|uniref:Uncharacterized protein n=1 Tax=Halobium palmae TaxID=1776492 RepID=A0ABD5RWH5_9EURY
MTRHEATFEIDSKTDAHAVRILLVQSHDGLREQLREVDLDSTLERDVLRDLGNLRSAANPRLGGG